MPGSIMKETTDDRSPVNERRRTEAPAVFGPFAGLDHRHTGGSDPYLSNSSILRSSSLARHPCVKLSHSSGWTGGAVEAVVAGRAGAAA
jgi:hypothetical protein